MKGMSRCVKKKKKKSWVKILVKIFHCKTPCINRKNNTYSYNIEYSDIIVNITIY